MCNGKGVTFGNKPPDNYQKNSAVSLTSKEQYSLFR